MNLAESVIPLRWTLLVDALEKLNSPGPEFNLLSVEPRISLIYTKKADPVAEGRLFVRLIMW
jgi:hypothetical protein